MERTWVPCVASFPWAKFPGWKFLAGVFILYQHPFLKSDTHLLPSLPQSGVVGRNCWYGKSRDVFLPQQLVSDGGSPGWELFILLSVFTLLSQLNSCVSPVLLRWSFGGRAVTVQLQAETGRRWQEEPASVPCFTAERPLPAIFPNVPNAVCDTVTDVCVCVTGPQISNAQEQVQV